MSPDNEKPMGMQERRAYENKEFVIMPTSYCPGNCKYCYLDRKNIAVNKDIDWEKFYAVVYEALTSVDFSLENGKKSSICIAGGELMCDALLNDDKFRTGLEGLIRLVARTVKDTRCRVSIPVACDNLNDRGVEFIKWIKEEMIPLCQINCAFSIEKVPNPEREKRYFENLYKIQKYVNAVMIPMCHKEDYDLVNSKYSFLFNDFKVTYDEPIMINKELAYSFGDVDWYLKPIEYRYNSPHCNADREEIVTPHGIFMCGEITRKPEWVSDEEWTKFGKDKEYQGAGYQEVMDWYGCTTCEKQSFCPGMCFVTYYAQKYLFNNRKCLYRSQDEFKRSGLGKEETNA